MTKAYRNKSKRLPANVSFRPIRPSDMAFLERLYASSREEEMKVVPWSKEEQASFLGSQFAAQHQHYANYFRHAEFLIIEQARQPIGRVYVDRRKDEIRLIDIILSPEFRGHGLGSCLLRDLLDEGQQRHLPVRIHVEKNNPAMSLYRRLEFEPIEDKGVYYLMQWTPKIEID